MAETLRTLDFQDTELTFSYMDDRQLKSRYRLFKLMDSPLLTRLGPPMVTLLLKSGLPIKNIVKRSIFDVFCGGESLEDTESRSNFLFEYGVRTILDFSVEGKKTDDSFDETCEEIIRTLVQAHDNLAVAFSAMKVTGLADIDILTKFQAGKPLSASENLSLNRSKERVEAICRKAAELGQSVFIDAEESWIQDVIDTWAEEMMEKYNRSKPIVYTTIQFYRHTRLPYLQKLIENGRLGKYYIGVKVVRGAYLEKERERASEMHYPDPIQPNKKATDTDFDAGLEMCIQNIEVTALCAGTHNIESSRYLAELLATHGVERENVHVIFAQLLGMSDNISFNLAHHGYNVAKYLPYGPVSSVLPYLFRRANENTSVGGQASRELVLLEREIRRRGI